MAASAESVHAGFASRESCSASVGSMSENDADGFSASFSRLRMRRDQFFNVPLIAHRQLDFIRLDALTFVAEIWPSALLETTVVKVDMSLAAAQRPYVRLPVAFPWILYNGTLREIG